MSPAFPHIDKPAVVTEVPSIQSRPERRRIEALWPVRNIHSDLDGDGIEYAVLSVMHFPDRRAYCATINRQSHHASGVVGTLPFDASRVGPLIPTGRFSQKSLEAAFHAALQTLRDEISAGDQKLAAYFTPSQATGL